jgi:heavy metal sensor kinase
MSIGSRPRGIRVSLTLWYVGAIVVVLAIYAATVFTFVTRNLSEALNDRLRSEVEWAVATADLNADQTLRWFEDDRNGGMYSLWLQVRRPDGTMIFRTAVAERNPIRDDASAVSPEEERIVTFVGDDGNAVRLLTSWQMIFDMPVVIQVAAPEAPMQAQVDRLVAILALGLPLGVAVAGIGGYLLARRALAPVERIAARARTITAERLSDRLPVDNPDDELGHLATVFNETLGRLESSFDQMRRFTADVSHELRTPLTAIRTVGEVGLRERRDAPGYRSVIFSMLEEVDRLRGLVDRLLALSRSESGQITLRRESVKFRQLVDEVVAQLGVLAEEKGQQLSVEAIDDPAGLADRGVLRQSIVNLIDNAIKYTPVGGRIRVRISGSPTFATLEVSDSGPGIAPEVRTRMFDRFNGSAAERGSEIVGSGLGLSIARWAVEANGGQLTVEPGEASAGSVFRITLPRADVAPPESRRRLA